MKERILLVDDEEGIRNVLSISLTDAGYEVHTAESVAKALEMFRRLLPAIVLADIKMPGGDGMELLRQVKTERHDTEVIMITGYGDQDLATRSKALEAADFVAKPISQEALDIALERAMKRIEARRKAKADAASPETVQ
jgi:DNA-binding NtrC family response regulator